MFQLRLGWLVPLVNLLSRERLEKGELASKLLALAREQEDGVERQVRWLEQAGLERAPQGRISPRASDEVVRMGAAFGVHDPVACSPTDLGRVLSHLAGSVSPFAWPPPKRLVGLRILLGADGDVALALLRSWPAGGVLAANDALAFTTRVLRSLATASSSDSDRVLLERQAAKTRPRDVVHPRMEPLRELGLVSSGNDPGSYVLTAPGRHFIDSVGAKDAGALLRNGLAQALLAMDDLAPSGRAAPDELLVTLRSLPAEFQGAAQEAPLEAVALLTQARLLAQGSTETLDLDDSMHLVTELGGRSAGRIGLKAGASVGGQNVTWSDDSVLAESYASTAAHTSKPEQPGPLGSPAPTDSPPPPPRDGETTRLDHHPPSLLWLTYLLRLLDRPYLGSVECLSTGGPWAWSEALLQSLTRPGKIVASARRVLQVELEGLKKEELPWAHAPRAIVPFRRWCHDVKDLQEWLLPFWAALVLRCI